MTSSICNRCSGEKPSDRYRRCAKCRERSAANRRASAAKWRREHPAAAIRRDLRTNISRYNMTLDQYDAMLASQSGRCAICKSSNPGGGNRRMSVDHDHRTQRARALLCTRCNHGVAYHEHELRHAFALYLRQHAEPSVATDPLAWAIQ